MANVTGKDTLIATNTIVKASIKFSELIDIEGTSLGLDDIVVYYGDVNESGMFIVEADFNFIDSNCDVNMLGVSESSTACLLLYDRTGVLSPDNEDSPYYSTLINGVHVKIEINDHEENNTPVWEPYGEWYITSVTSELADGEYQPLRICLQDRLNILGDMEITNDEGELAAISGVTAAEILDGVLSNIKWLGVNLESGVDYVIDSAITAMDDAIFGVTSGSKVRDIINNVCRTCLARAYIRLDGKLYIEKYNKKHTSNTWIVDGMTAIHSINNSNALYSSVCVKYYNRKRTASELIASYDLPDIPDQESELVLDGTNIIFVPFNKSVASIDRIETYVPMGEDENQDENATLTVTKWTGWSNGCYIETENSTEDEELLDCRIDVYGHVPVGQPKLSNVYPINDAVVTATNSVLYYVSDQILTKSDANKLARRIATYFKNEMRKKTMNDTIYSMKMCIGDKLVLQGVNSNFNGDYRITGVSISLGETYSLSLELVNA